MESFTLIIFGITSNLAHKKLLPALFALDQKGLLPQSMHIVGIARKELSSNEFHDLITGALSANAESQQKEGFLSRFHYISGYFEDMESGEKNLYPKLKKFLDSHGEACDNKLYYLATYPNLYPVIFSALKKFGLNTQDCGWVRLMVEKPLGSDLPSAKTLDNLLHEYFSEDQIYRMDHYLGKETVQNLLTFRFANNLLSPLMNKDYVDNIQITASEEIGISGRGGYYDLVGALRDVGQNHLLQMLAVSTMELPKGFSNESITKERVKVLESLVPKPERVVFGQYNGYLYEDKVSPESKTETFFALETEINNDTWKGVPIFLRSGKNLDQTLTQIVVVFKKPTNKFFSHLELSSEPNILTFKIKPEEGLAFSILTKKPDIKFDLKSELLEFHYPKESVLPNAYEHLLYDALKGDATFFTDAAEIEAEWNFVDPILAKEHSIHIYEPGSQGPKEADELLSSTGRVWI